jgi:hypothetical protein
MPGGKSGFFAFVIQKPLATQSIKPTMMRVMGRADFQGLV